MASEGMSPVSTAMQGQELKALLKETIRELLHEEPGLLGASDPSSASEKPHTVELNTLMVSFVPSRIVELMADRTAGQAFLGAT